MRTSEYQDVLFQPLPGSTPLSAGQEHAGLGDAAGRFGRTVLSAGKEGQLD